MHEYSDDPLQYILFDESSTSGMVWSYVYLNWVYAATSGQTNLRISFFTCADFRCTSHWPTNATMWYQNRPYSTWNHLKARRISSHFQPMAKIILQNFISMLFDSAALQLIRFMSIVKVKITLTDGHSSTKMDGHFINKNDGLRKIIISVHFCYSDECCLSTCPQTRSLQSVFPPKIQFLHDITGNLIYLKAIFSSGLIGCVL